jgi:predicted transcriptional regulator
LPEKKVPHIPILLTLSELQHRILLHICMTNDASYNTLMKCVNRDRITILQSLESLIKYRYIEKQKINPEREKSKLIFLSTHKGKAYAWSELGLDLKDMIKTSTDDEIANYIEFIKDVFIETQHKQMVEDMFNILERGYLDYQEGVNKKRALVKESFSNGILKLSQGNNFYPQALFSNKTIQWLKKLFTPEELHEFKHLFIQITDNLTETIKRFPG